jgi:hypothetical protein
LNDPVPSPRAGVALLLVTLSLAACGPGNELNGSIGALATLEFNEVLFRKQSDFVIIQYQKRSVDNAEIVCKVAVATEPMPPKKTFEGDSFRQQVTLSRTTLDQRSFPDISKGTLRFDRLDFRHDGAVAGRLDAVFTDGNTLGALFDGRLVEILLQ